MEGQRSSLCVPLFWLCNKTGAPLFAYGIENYRRRMSGVRILNQNFVVQQDEIWPAARKTAGGRITSGAALPVALGVAVSGAFSCCLSCHLRCCGLVAIHPERRDCFCYRWFFRMRMIVMMMMFSFLFLESFLFSMQSWRCRRVLDKWPCETLQ